MFLVCASTDYGSCINEKGSCTYLVYHVILMPVKDQEWLSINDCSGMIKCQWLLLHHHFFCAAEETSIKCSVSVPDLSLSMIAQEWLSVNDCFCTITSSMPKKRPLLNVPSLFQILVCLCSWWRLCVLLSKDKFVSLEGVRGWLALLSSCSTSGNLYLSRGNLSLLWSANLRSALSVRWYARLGISLSLLQNADIGDCISVLDMATMGSSVSLAEFARLGSGFSIVRGWR